MNKDSNHLNEAKDILNDLENELAKKKLIWQQLDIDNPGFELSEKNWRDHQASCWLHGATDLRESNELERWLVMNPPLSDLAKTKALKCITAWKEWLTIKDAYYSDSEDFEFEKPFKRESLIEFLYRTAGIVEKEGPLARAKWRALKSFLGYLRHLCPEEIAFIEQIFPRKMEIKHGRIIRKIAPEVPAIPVEIAAAILMDFAKTSRKGRKDAQITALESLGLCWLCLTTSRLRLPMHLEIIHSTPASSL